VIDSFAKASDSSTVLAGTMRDLPSQLRTELSQLIAELDARQAGFDATLSRAEALVASTDQAAQSLSKMGEVWTDLVATFARTMEQIDPPSAEPAANARPFDINDYRSTADELTRTAIALSGVLAQARELTGQGETASLNDALESAVQSVLVRLGLFVLFVALVMIAYRFIVGRLPQRAG
jgi:ABC-type transporter Mla subunit MlaD